MKTVIILLLLLPNLAFADAEKSFFINLPLTAKHGEQPAGKKLASGKQTLNEKNYGLGIYYGSNSFNYGGTILKDSNGHASLVAGAEVACNLPTYKGFSGGVGLFTGLTVRKVEGVLPMLLPTLHLSYNNVSLNISYLPQIDNDGAGIDIPELLFFSVNLPLVL